LREIVSKFKALSDHTRLRMLKLLNGCDELCVCEIMEILQISQSRASRNLNILKAAGLLEDRRSGKWICYSLKRDGADNSLHVLSNLVDTWLEKDRVAGNDMKRMKRVTESNLKEKCCEE